MVKPRKTAVVLEAPAAPRVGDKVIPEGSTATWEISRVSPSGEVELSLPNTNLQRFRVNPGTLKYVDCAPENKPQQTLFADHRNVIDRIAAVQKENLQRLDDDISILTKYLKTERAPKAVNDALDALASEQHEAWDKAVERISELMED